MQFIAMAEISERAHLAEVAVRLHQNGWVANHDGNVSLRLASGRYLATPTATSKAAVRADNLIVVDDSGARVSGSGKPFSEINLHLTVYRLRADVRAVVHAHPRAATAFAVAGLALDRPFIAEAVVSLGPSIPLVPFALPGAAAAEAIAPFVREHDAVLLGNHGVLTWGADLEQAYLRMELVEHLAAIASLARGLGDIRPLPASALAPLIEARRKAGFVVGAAAPALAQTVVACAPAPLGSNVTVYERPRNAAKHDVTAIIREEIARALAEK